MFAVPTALRLCVYILVPMKCLEVSPLAWTRKGKKIISFTALFEHEGLLSSSSPPPDLVSPGSINGSHSAPLLRCARHFQ